MAGQTLRNFEVILVDNGSTDCSAAYVREYYPWVRIVDLPENTGFAGGNNRGLKMAEGEFIVTLNNDTKADPRFLEELLQPALQDSGIGMVAAKMLNFFDPGRIDSVGVKAANNGMGYNIGVGERDAGQYDTPTQLFGPCAGAALYRRTMLDQVGFFDPDFFAYYEDLDLAWRGRLAGWSCVTAPQAVVHHIHSATSGRMSAFTVYHVQRNKWYTILKNWPFSLLLKSFPKILVYDVAAIILAVLRGKGGAALRARLEVIRNLRTLLHKRQEVQQMTKLTSVEVAALFAPAAQSIETFSRKMRE
jgi:GT2 family glycosyltransferase